MIDSDLVSDAESASAALAFLRIQIEQDERYDYLRQPGIKYVRGLGNVYQPKVMFIGEAPGPMENASGVPFVGKAGRIFKDLLVSNKFAPFDIFVTNVMKYMPCHDGTMNFRKPTQEEVELARDSVAQEVKIVQPTVVCLMGNVPIRAFFNDQHSVTKLRGELYAMPAKPDVFVTYHPSFINYHEDKLPVLQRDFRKLASFVMAPAN